MKIVYEMYREQEKKHSWRYKSDGTDTTRPVTFYIPKLDIGELAALAPEHITVTILELAGK